MATTIPRHTRRRGSRRRRIASITGVKITYSPVMKADVDDSVYWSPTVWVMYPANSSRPATVPTRQSRLGGSRLRRAIRHANGANTAAPTMNRMVT